MREITFGDVFAVTLLGAPLLISLWFLINIGVTRARDRRQRSMRGVLVTSSLYILIIFMIALVTHLVAVAVNPSILAATPLAVKLAIIIIMLTFYGCFAALALGLKEAVRAGGSSTRIIGELLRDVKEDSRSDRDGKSTETTDREKKD